MNDDVIRAEFKRAYKVLDDLHNKLWEGMEAAIEQYRARAADDGPQAGILRRMRASDVPVKDLLAEHDRLSAAWDVAMYAMEHIGDWRSFSTGDGEEDDDGE